MHFPLTSIQHRIILTWSYLSPWHRLTYGPKKSLEVLQNKGRKEQWWGIGSIFSLFHFNFLNINKQKSAKPACYSVQQSLSDSLLSVTTLHLYFLPHSRYLLKSHLPATVTHVMYPVGWARLSSETVKHRMKGETSFTKTWQMKTAKIILWSSIRLRPYCFLNHSQQSSCWNKNTHVKWKKKTNPSLGVHDCNLFHPDCPSLSLCIGIFTSVSQDPRVHDVLCFAGHAFPWLSPTGQTKLENLHCEKQCHQSICRISVLQNYFFTLVSCVPKAFHEYKGTVWAA